MYIISQLCLSIYSLCFPTKTLQAYMVCKCYSLHVEVYTNVSCQLIVAQVACRYGGSQQKRDLQIACNLYTHEVLH